MPCCAPLASQQCPAASGAGPSRRMPACCLPLPMATWYLVLIGALLAASQTALTHPDALLVFPGQMAQLSCTLSPHQAAIKDYGVSWYQQRAGSAPRYLLYYRSEDDQHRPDDIPARFSAARDMARNTCILTISPVWPEDDADYYCSVAYSSSP